MCRRIRLRTLLGCSLFAFFYIALAISVVLLSSSCTAQPYWQDDRSIITPAVHLSPTTTPISTKGWQEYVVIGTVNIRSQPDVNSVPAGLLFKGAKVQADCNRSDRFCEVIGGYVISACLGIGEEPCK